MNPCAQKTGFLTLKTCGQPAVAACRQCGKMICAEHLQKDPGPLCPDCAVAGMDPVEASHRGWDSSYYRYRHSSGTDSDLTTYSSSDYSSFETTEGAGGESGGGGASSDWSDSEAGGSDTGGEGDSSDSGSSGDFQDS